ncbi:MAG: von Willebrand factor type A domain-containing protein [Chitinophagaceae bacterium]|nr:von Willebrand factor type A domain-containing protein [Chitinophagaceae bacterium]
MLANFASGQYYLRGEVRDEKSQPIQNAKIFLHSSRLQYFSGSSGGFGITTKALNDSITVSLDGYETKIIKVIADQWQNINLKISTSNANKNKPKLISVTKNLQQSSKVKWFVDEETYFQIIENEHVDASKYPNTGFSLNVNKASYSNVRRFINMQSTVPPDAIRTEEVINYFNLHYQEPPKGDVFKIESQLATSPWDEQEQLLFINVNAKKVDLEKAPSGNFVFLIDASGSMDMPNKLPLLKAAFQLFVKNLRTKDTVSIVVYGGTVAVWLPPTGGAEKEKIIKRIEELDALGDTPGEAAILTAYRLAEKTFIEGGNNRVILATDGDFNVGISSEKELDELITKERQKGVYLTCLGVGMGNFKDSKLETLAKRGDGNYAYLDDIAEAEKVLVKELTQTFYAVADDVYLNIQFNPNLIKEYRLIGFDNKRDAVSDSAIDLEGGEIGSGNSVMAVFEIKATNEKLLRPDAINKSEIAKISFTIQPL